MDAKETCVFYRDWVETARTIQDPKTRCFFYEAILEYSLNGMKMEVAPELELFMTYAYRLIDKDKERYEKKCEKRREAGRRGGAPIGNQNARKHEEQTNQSNACFNNQNNQTQSIQANNDNDNGNVNDNDKDNDFYNNEKSNKSPLTPKGVERHGGAESFKDFYYRATHVRRPVKVIEEGYEAQYVWRIVDNDPGYAMEIRDAIASGKTGDSLRFEFHRIGEQHKPRTTEFQAVKLALETGSLKTEAQRAAVIAEADRAAGEPDIFATLLAKVRYIKDGNKVNNLAAFMKARNK